MDKIAFEIIGHILIIRDLDYSKEHLQKFAISMIKKYPKIRTVALQSSKVSGQERLRSLQFFFGENNFETTYREHGAQFQLNPSLVFFSPRLSYERQRIANLVKDGETIVNFFSGVGPFSIIIACKHPKCTIHSVEINKIAYEYLVRNISLNKCEGRVIPYFGDCFDIIPKFLLNSADRVLLPLPLLSDQTLPLAIKTLRNDLGIIHWEISSFLNSPSEVEDVVAERIRKLRDSFTLPSFSTESVKIVRWLSPKIGHIAVDLQFA